MTKRTLASAEEALHLLEELQAGKSQVTVIELSGELKALEVNIRGAAYHGTVPGELARGLWEFQEALYKAAAFAINGEDDIRRLTTAQRQGLELVFEVHEGSTELIVEVTKFINTLSGGLASMDDQTKMIVLISVALILAVGVVAWKALDVSAQRKKDELLKDADVALEREKTRQFEIFAQVAGSVPAVQKFERAAEEGTRAIIRSASDADDIKIGRVKFDSDDIQEVVQRAPRVKSQAEVVEDVFHVFGTDTRMVDATKYILSRHNGNQEFPVTISHGDLSGDEIARLWEAARSRKPIRLEVALTTNRGVVKAAQVVAVL
jgi:hypothetical protein